MGQNSVLNKSYDHLTGLPDMNYFFELVRANYKERKKSDNVNAVIYLDLYGMKNFNQQHGFDEGDRLLKAVADILAGHFGHDNCCRLMADRFAIFTDCTDLDNKLDEVLRQIELTNGCNSLPVRVGVYNSDMGVVSATTACDRAKIACDSVKSVYSSNISYFDKQMLEEYEIRHYILGNFEQALRDGRIKVLHQPIVRIANNLISDDEALARWEDPVKGSISPLVFVPILEEARLIHKLDLFVTDRVIEKHLLAKEKGLPLVPESINLSRADFYACDIVEEIKERVDKAGIEHRYFIFEITENVVIKDQDYIKSQINRAHELGFKVWIDDFGSGFSSPDFLQDIPFDAIKIDKEFMDKIPENEKSKIVVTELIKIASAFGSETIAEGVERRDQVDFLRDIGCSKIQGYYFLKPISQYAIFERYQKGTKTVFENPDEYDYYLELGKVSVYDMSFFTEDGLETGDFFDTLPMVVLEVADESISVVKHSRTYRRFMDRNFPSVVFKVNSDKKEVVSNMGAVFKAGLEDAIRGTKRQFVDVTAEDGSVLRLLIQRIAYNDIRRITAIKVVILGHIHYGAELQHIEAIKRIEEERKSYQRILALSGDYICMYSIDMDTNAFVEYSSSGDYSSMNVPKEGSDFFAQPFTDGMEKIYVDDRPLFSSVFSKEEVLKQIDEKGLFTMNYRIIFEGELRYVCLKVAKVSEENGKRLIAGIIDIDAQVKKEEEYSSKLSTAQNEANIDALTGIKNKNAYSHAENRLNEQIKASHELRFGIVVFDINNLKLVNDTKGHKAGDELIRKGCHIICTSFKHSPVFRVGGDEFVAIVKGEDYDNVDSLMKEFHNGNLERKKADDVVIASGLAIYRDDNNLSQVFERADSAMYRDKQALKA
ncbi:sensor domain-containing diguanylate cyclase [Butyrivibrio sp. MC2013]|uniref:sensor domain-containing diguanylate cyclase n=1 Tax=Butyrivibrio sp. MC2013 TaxID=1280686 RepID=UPI00041F8492|nr:EAL domain-containing protein [Butyrivibrio sp. MC2013]